MDSRRLAPQQIAAANRRSASLPALKIFNTGPNMGDKLFAIKLMDFLRTERYTHFAEKAKSVLKSTSQTAFATLKQFVYRSFELSTNRKQRIARPLPAI